MRLAIVGGGPAGLYLGILMKLRDPQHTVTLFERNPAGETFGWGVVFSAQTLDHFDTCDKVSAAQIRANFAWWDDIDVFAGDAHVRSTGHGFCGLARVKLLEILTDRATELGCEIRRVEVSEAEFDTLRASYDAVVVADGVNSQIRARFAAQFVPTVQGRRCRFTWLGLDARLPAFTFYFDESSFGLFQVHAYPFVPEGGEAVNGAKSTFIVECDEAVWRKAGLDTADDAASIDRISEVFAHRLQGAKLLANRSIWRAFPNVRCERWSFDNVALVGDAAHTAHFSIGSGTKLAMEDVIALCDALHQHVDVPSALAAYEAQRRPEVERLQTSAQTSLEWFENTQRYMGQSIHRFTFGLMTRSKRITWDELKKRDPGFVAEVQAEWCTQAGVSPREPMFTPFKTRSITLPNRIVVSPMCQYSAKDGVPDDWHLVHLGSRALGGAGLVIAEATAVTAEGRITPGCTGIWNDQQAEAWARIVRFVHTQTPLSPDGHRTCIGLQLGHAGRKASCHLPWSQGGAPLSEGAWTAVGPTDQPYDVGWPAPAALTEDQIVVLVEAYRLAARRAAWAGFDVLELHLAHGYLLSTFVSALTNTRTDGWGGDLAGRLRLPLVIVRAIREVWPQERPLFARISSTEWTPDAMTDAERAALATALVAAGVDLIDCSAGGVVPQQRPVYGRMFQVPFSDQLRNEAGVATIAVGNIQTADQANTILAAGRADLVALARGHLIDPYFTLHAAAERGGEVAWPPQYLSVAPRRRKQ